MRMSLYPALINSRALKAAASLMLCVAFTGCTELYYPITGATSGQTFKSLDGNWQIALTATTGPVPFTQLAGYIDEQSKDGASGYPVSASLQLAGPSSCFAAARLIPASGQILKDQLGLYSFTINGQYVDTASTLDAGNASFTGTYVVQDGCAGSLSSAGTLVGTHYADLTGNFAGPLSSSDPNIGLTLALTQVPTGNSDGTFDISGTATISGLACYAQTSLASLSGSVLGSSVQLVFNDPATNSQVAVSGSFDPTAHTITLTSVNVSGGSCAGSLGPASLTLQG